MKSIISLTLDVTRCTNCRACELACSFAKEGAYTPALSRIQVVPVFSQGVNVPIFCVHCADAACMQACPTDAILREDDKGAVVIDADLCTACGECVAACPIGAIQIPDGRHSALMCDLCGGDPSCVAHCIYGALRFDGQPDSVFQGVDQSFEAASDERKRWRVASSIAVAVREPSEVGR